MLQMHPKHTLLNRCHYLFNYMLREFNEMLKKLFILNLCHNFIPKDHRQCVCFGCTSKKFYYIYICYWKFFLWSLLNHILRFKMDFLSCPWSWPSASKQKTRFKSLPVVSSVCWRLLSTFSFNHWNTVHSLHFK